MAGPATAPRPPARHRRTIRLRLTAMYSSLFLLTGTAVLTLGYLLARHSVLTGYTLLRETAEVRHKFDQGLLSGQSHAVQNAASSSFEHVLKRLFTQGADRTLNHLALEFVGILVLMTVVSVVAGWLLAGRALAPLRAITTTARRVSGENLGERIALEGPDDELRELADTFDGMLARLDQSFASQRHFVANASHELRTPLAIMRTEIDVALADPDASVEDLRETAEQLLETIDRSEALIGALLTLARSEAAQVAHEPVELAPIIDSALAHLQPAIRERSLRIENDSVGLAVSGDRQLLERMIANLVQNAVLHNRAGGIVEIATARDDEFVQLTLENDGAALDPKQVQELTRPFRRLDREVPGFGVGLSIAASIVAAHDGRLQLSARPTGGLRVEVLLPRDRQAESGSGSAAKRAPPPTAG